MAGTPMRPIVSFLTLVVSLGMFGSAPVYAREVGPADAGVSAAPAQDRAAYAPLIVSIPHHLAEAEAERRVKDAIAGLQKDYGYLLTIDRQVWHGPHLRFDATVMGQPARGRIDIAADHVDVKVMMPASLSVLVDLAQPVLLRQGTQMLAKQ
jgi:hypothetical protein